MNARSRGAIRLLLLTVCCAGLSLAGSSSVKSQSRDYLPPGQQGSGPDNGPRPIAPPRQRDNYDSNPGYGQPYSPPPPRDSYDARNDYADQNTYSSNEIVDAGRRFFGGAAEGLAKVVEYAFSRYGRPTGYILGEEASGAVAVGLRYGEGTLYTKGFGTAKLYWQGPSLGYDFGGNGSKSMTLVYNLHDVAEIFNRFPGVEGSAYFVGGVGITFQQHDNVILAPIRAGVGLRLGANVGYVKYTPSPTWNPF